MDVLCTFKIKIGNQTLEHRCITDQWPYPSQDQDSQPHSGTSSVLQSPKSGLEGHRCSLKIKIERQTLEHRSIRDQWPYPNEDQDAKPHSGTSSVLQSPKWGAKGHGCSLHLQNEDKEPKFGSWVSQRLVNISKSRSRCQTPVRNLQHPPKPKMRT